MEINQSKTIGINIEKANLSKNGGRSNTVKLKINLANVV